MLPCRLCPWAHCMLLLQKFFLLCTKLLNYTLASSCTVIIKVHILNKGLYVFCHQKSSEKIMCLKWEMCFHLLVIPLVITAILNVKRAMQFAPQDYPYHLLYSLSLYEMLSAESKWISQAFKSVILQFSSNTCWIYWCALHSSLISFVAT